VFRLVRVSKDYVGIFWPHVGHHIRKAMQRGGMGEYETVARDVLNGPDQLWLATDGKSVGGVAITSLSQSVCTIVACGGDIKQHGHMIEGIEKFAKDEGCKVVRICGRPGWSRRLSGYRTKKVLIEKAL